MRLFSIVVLAGVVVGCGKGAETRCEEAAQAVARTADPQIAEGIAARAARHCRDDGWSVATTDCLKAAVDPSDCESTMTTEQVRRLLEDSPFDKPIPMP
jgi:hypothetical protein